MYRGLRDHDPVHHVEDGDYYFLSRFDDVFAAAADSRTYSSARGLTVNYDEIEHRTSPSTSPVVATPRATTSAAT